MKNNTKKNTRKSLFRNIAYGAAGLVFLAGSYKAISYSNDKNFIKPEDFRKAEWIEFYNPNGLIWDAYKNENIPQNQSNWHLYIDEVREKNNNNLEGIIRLPDLDNDGKVGK